MLCDTRHRGGQMWGRGGGRISVEGLGPPCRRQGRASRLGREGTARHPPPRPPSPRRTNLLTLGPEKTRKDAAELPCLPPPPLSRGACLAACGVRGARGRSLRPSPPCHARPCRQRAAGTVVRPPTSTTPRGEGGGCVVQTSTRQRPPYPWEQEEGRLAGTTPYLGRRGRDPKSGQGPGAPASTGAHPGLGETAHAREDGGSECERVCGNEVPPFERRDPTLTIRESQNLFSERFGRGLSSFSLSTLLAS